MCFTVRKKLFNQYFWAFVHYAQVDLVVAVAEVVCVAFCLRKTERDFLTFAIWTNPVTKLCCDSSVYDAAPCIRGNYVAQCERHVSSTIIIVLLPLTVLMPTRVHRCIHS